MSRAPALALGVLVLCLIVGGPGCGPDDASRQVAVPGQPGRTKSSALARAERRAFDGAPPVIPHAPFGVACSACHTQAGLEVPDVGYAPPNPHAETAGLGLAARCNQCHVFRTTDALFAPSHFAGLPQDLRRGQRLNTFAPPVLPHPVFMRENCLACHAGPAAREEVRTSHPERQRCQQCHVEQTTTALFE